MKKLLVLILSLTLCLGLLSFTGCAKEENSPNIEINQNGISETVWDIFDGSSTSGFGIKTLTSQTVVTENEKYLEKTLQATVSGSEVNMKPLSLKWTAIWQSNGLAVDSSFLTLNVDSTDSTICNVRLLSPLSETAVIYVECLNNKISASCLVEYSGKARNSDVYISLSDSPNEELVELYDEEFGIYYYDLIQGNNYRIVFDVFGFFDDWLTPSYDSEVKVTCSAIGQINFQKETSGIMTAQLKNPYNLSDFIEPVYDFDLDKTNVPLSSTAYRDYMDYEIDENYVFINALTALENLKVMERPDNDTFGNCYGGYDKSLNEGLIVPYVQFTFTCGEFTEIVNVRIKTDLSLSLNNSNITFE